MASRVNVLLVDDIDESEASETVSYALDGTSYEIDLNEGHAAELREALAYWVEHSRRTGKASTTKSSGRRSGGSTVASDKERVQAIRDWANKNGHEVAERGRIKASVVEAYDAAN